MKRQLTYASIIGLLLTMTACPDPSANRNGKFQATPVNLEAINSEFDDYNSTLPANKVGQNYLIFSSKRDRKDKFNLVVKPFQLTYDDQTDRLNLESKAISGNLDVSKNEYYYNQLIKKANQDCNILGPLLIPLSYLKDEKGNFLTNRYLLLYADDSAGNLQIKFVHNMADARSVEGPFEISWLNSAKDDAYPTFSQDYKRVYFCSDRDGGFDIFEANLPGGEQQFIDALLSNIPLSIVKNEQLSTTSDDKCPYVISNGWNDVMYFVSNRPGGEGGFDIHYASYDGSKWNKPANLGPRINTKYDEYRPMVPRMQLGPFDYDLGIFSSNRPGGKGGFDLYMAGFLKQGEAKF